MENMSSDRFGLLREVIGEKHPIPLGWWVLCQIFVDGDKHLLSTGSQSLFDRPDDTKEGDVYRRGAGRVLAMGSDAFAGSRFEGWDIKPQVGDWVNFGRGDGVFRAYNDVQTLLVKDYSIVAISQDPSIESYHQYVGT